MSGAGNARELAVEHATTAFRSWASASGDAAASR